jgi:DNA-binding NarL/FixJ family response regulator
MLGEFRDLAPRLDDLPETAGLAPLPDVVVSYVPTGAVGLEAAEGIEAGAALVLIVEGTLTELPDLSERPVALLPAEADAATLHTAVGAVAQGMSLVDTVFAASSGITWRQPHLQPAELADQLTAREIQVLDLVAQGLPNKTIAVRLGISEHTVKFHVGSILAKLGAESRTEAVTIATRRGIVAI